MFTEKALVVVSSEREIDDEACTFFSCKFTEYLVKYKQCVYKAVDDAYEATKHQQKFQNECLEVFKRGICDSKDCCLFKNRETESEPKF